MGLIVSKIATCDICGKTVEFESVYSKPDNWRSIEDDYGLIKYKCVCLECSRKIKDYIENSLRRKKKNRGTKMIRETIYVAINHNDEIQWVRGSSSKTRYFRTDKYLKKAVDYHNKLHPEDIWKVRKCLIVEDIPETDRRTRQDYMDYFSHMEYEEIHDGPLGGQAWDEISWWEHEAINIDKVFTLEELVSLYPKLFKWQEND